MTGNIQACCQEIRGARNKSLCWITLYEIDKKMLFFFQAGLAEGPNLPAGGSKLIEISQELSLSRWTLDLVYNCFSVNVCTLSLMMFLFILNRQGYIFYWMRLYFICLSGSVRIDLSWGGLCSIIFPCLWSSEAVTKIYFGTDI